ncbi:MAG: S-layer homology domain-containing protein [Clostridia bacterium]|jgi:hypothetical protein
MKNVKSEKIKKAFTKRFKFRLSLSLIATVVVLIAICGTVYGINSSNIKYSIASTKQQFMIGLSNSISQLANRTPENKVIFKDPGMIHYDSTKPTEQSVTFKIGADTNLTTENSGIDFQMLKNYAINLIARTDNINKRASFDLNLLKNNAELLTGQFYADNNILALKSKELYPQFFTTNNSNLIQTFTNLGLTGFTVDKLDIDLLVSGMDSELKTKLNTLMNYMGTLFMDNLDDTMFTKVTENRDIGGTSISGDAITMDLTGVQFVTVLKAMITEISDNTEIKALMKDLINNYLLTSTGSTQVVTDSDINTILDDLYETVDTNSAAIADIISKMKIELFIVDAISVQTKVQISIDIEEILFDLNINISEALAQIDFDASLSLSASLSTETQTIALETSGYIKNITEVNEFVSSESDIKIEGSDPMPLAMALLTAGQNLTTLAENDPLLKMIMDMIESLNRAYPDVTEDEFPWAYNEIQTLSDLGIIHGRNAYGVTIFDPNSYMTRAEAVTVVVNAFELTGKGSDAAFKDVSKKAWYYNSIGKAFKHGIIKGTAKQKFAPNRPISRQDMCMLIVRAMVSEDYIPLISTKKIDENLMMYVDQAKISKYSKRHVATGVYNGIIIGKLEKGAMKLYPRRYATRAEAAVMVYRSMFGDSDGIVSGFNSTGQLSKTKILEIAEKQILRLMSVK